MKIEVTGLFFFISSSHFVSLYSTRKKEKKVQKVPYHITSKFIIVSAEYILGGILLEYLEAEFFEILRILEAQMKKRILIKKIGVASRNFLRHKQLFSDLHGLIS